ncbi:MAG: hypothetical protein BWK78_06260 [Thiotrichaceae bacterium IS1]|nr:MAG: hypothetical protein BWK78_06260 [Thiotrichaceae bacterium IS1]
MILNQTPLERIDLSMSPAVKNTLTQAAEIVKLSVNAFILECAYEYAKDLLAEQNKQTIVLSDSDWQQFQVSLEENPAPNESLKQLMQTNTIS